MAEWGDDRFRPRVAPPRSKRSGRPDRFVSRVLRSASKAGALRTKTLTSVGRGGAKLGRGHAAAAFASRGLDARSRRVVVKTRLVVLGAAGPRSSVRHLGYIERDGVTKDGKPGQAYDATHDRADTAAFAGRGRDDRHEFRLIVSAEDAEMLGDLRRFTRDLMGQMEADLGTRLEWVAVDHWDTDNPHTHIVLRGKDSTGQDLVIARDYISHGMRLRASALATEWLGPRTELEIQEARIREVEQERWTNLDRSLQKLAKGAVISRGTFADREDYSQLVGRLQRLAAMGLADEFSPGAWRLHSDMEPTLRAMGERGDIVRTMQRALGRERREFAVSSSGVLHAPVVGRVAGKGLIEEPKERGYVIVDGLDGRAHYIPLPSAVDIADLPTGSVIEVRVDSPGRPIDRAIASIVRDGVYAVRAHRDQLAATPDSRDLDRTLDAAVRRLEALRRAGVVSRLTEGLWQVPDDFVERAAAHDLRRGGDASVRVRSAWPIERQASAIGATWLDQQLVGGSVEVGEVGFGAEVRSALAQRQQFLIDHGLAERTSGRFVPTRDLIATLRARELGSVAKSIECESGLMHRPVVDGQRVSGVYRRSVLLASGRFALLDDGAGFSLVPWRSVIESRLGQSVSGIVRGGDVSWDFSRQRGLGIG